MLKNNISIILKEIDRVLSQTDEQKDQELVDIILSSHKIVTVGAGRVGMAARAFAMRLKHLGLDSYNLGDSNVPAVGEGDLVIVCSGSGETQTIYDLAKIAKENNTKVALITGNIDSRIGKMADLIVEIRAPSKVKPIEGFVSIQPMTTLNEQCLFIFFDALVLQIMDKMGETHQTMWERHSGLE